MLPDVPNPTNLTNISYESAIALKNEAHWQRLADISVQDAIGIWLDTLDNRNTRESYTWGLGELVSLGLLNLDMTLQELALVNNESLLDRIKQLGHWSEATRQSRAAAFLSFLRFLSRRTQGLIRRAVPSQEGVTRTFFKVREEVVTPAMTQAQWTKWLAELDQINRRDWLIARVTLQGGKRIREVLHLTSDNINFESKQILFRQSKTKRTIKETIVTYPSTVMDDLFDYLGERTGLVFVTRGGKPVGRTQVANTFAQAGEKAGLPFRITPHVLRASCITFLRDQGFSDADIMRLTGHASAEMIMAYDKRKKAENASALVSLVT